MNQYKRLLAMLEEQAGEATRAVGEYQNQQFRLLYIRSDLQTDTFRERAQEALDRAPNRRPLVDDEELGDWRAGVEVYDHAIVIHLPSGPNQGLLVSMEPEVARNLTDFLQECSQRLEQ